MQERATMWVSTPGLEEIPIQDFFPHFTFFLSEPAKRCELKLDGPQREKLIKSVYEEKSMWTRHCDEENCTTMPIEGTKGKKKKKMIFGLRCS